MRSKHPTGCFFIARDLSAAPFRSLGLNALFDNGLRIHIPPAPFHPLYSTRDAQGERVMHTAAETEP